MNKVTVSIIIVSYNVKNSLVKCVESITKFTKSDFDFEIIIIDNNSKDGTSGKLFSNDNIKFIKNSKNIGFTKALNQGIDIARGIYIFQLNPDTFLIEDTVSILHEYCRTYNCDILGPLIFDEKGVIRSSWWKKPTIFKAVLNISSIQSIIDTFFKISPPRSPNEVDSISGAAMFYKKIIFKEVDSFNENLFWDEDLDFCIRASKIGKKISIVTNTRLIHIGGESSKKDLKIAISNQILSKIKFFKIHNSKIEHRLFIFLCLIIIPFKIIFIILLCPIIPKLVHKIYPYLFTLRLIICKNFDVQLK